MLRQLRDRCPGSLQQLVQAMLHRAGYHLSYLGVSVVTVRRQLLLARAGVRDLVDIGANAGQWASAVRHGGYRGRLWSFEPAAEQFATCMKAASRDQDWSVQRCAAGAGPGTMQLRVSENSLYSSFLPVLGRGIEAKPVAVQVRSEEVPVRTLDDITAGLPGPLGVKIDVQGYESQVLDGASQCADRIAFLEMELSLVPVYEGEPLYREMLDRLEGMGFRLAMVEPVWPDIRTGEALQFNGLFLHEG